MHKGLRPHVGLGEQERKGDAQPHSEAWQGVLENKRLIPSSPEDSQGPAGEVREVGFGSI